MDVSWSLSSTIHYHLSNLKSQIKQRYPVQYVGI
jgi:hypothetical protein